MAEDRNFTLKIITPNRIFYEDDAVSIIKPGILTITKEDEIKEAALHAGFAEILEDEVTILAEIVEWPEEINAERAEAARKRAQERLQSKTPETDLARAETALLRAMARIEVLK